MVFPRERAYSVVVRGVRGVNFVRIVKHGVIIVPGVERRVFVVQVSDRSGFPVSEEHGEVVRKKWFVAIPMSWRCIADIQVCINIVTVTIENVPPFLHPFVDGALHVVLPRPPKDGMNMSTFRTIVQERFAMVIDVYIL